jgi:hypothetical protein
MRWLFRPAATLLGRLRYAHKFVVVGLVLLLPLGFVAKAYVDLQDGQIASSAKERVGVAYMAPPVELTAMAVAARHEVSTGAELGRVGVGAGIARVEEADRRHGAALGVAREWAAARELLLAADVAVPAQRERVGASTDVLIELALANGVLASTRAALTPGSAPPSPAHEAASCGGSPPPSCRPSTPPSPPWRTSSPGRSSGGPWQGWRTTLPTPPGRRPPASPR